MDHFEIGFAGLHFSFDRNRETNTPTKTRARRPSPRDMTAGPPVNEEMLRGLYHGDFRGLQFASPLAYTPISVPVNMMGLPTPTSDDEITQAALNEITAMMSERIPKLHRTHLLLGTAWRWPRFDVASGELVWEEIPDSVVADILVDLVTGKPAAILTDEQIAISIAENQVAYIQRKRRFEAAQVIVQYFGQKPASVTDYTAANRSGILPIVFAHDTDEGEIRGHSALARIIRDLKDYHDTDYRVSEILTKFVPKQVQTVESPETWRKENGLDTDAALAEFDIAANDFILNRKDETTDFPFLSADATSAHEKALERKYWKIIEGSGIPEIFWGISLSGNHADGDNQMQKGVQYVDAVRRELDDPYTDLYAASLRLLSIARGENYKPFKMGWNKLESISADTKSQILSRFATAVTSMAGSATLTPGQLLKLWELNFPETKPGEYDDFIKGITTMGLHKQFVGLDYASGLADFQGGEAGAAGDPAGKGAADAGAAR